MPDFQKQKPVPGTVLVTGGASGLGRSISLAFAEGGWNVVCHYFQSEEKALALKENIETLGCECELIKGDLTSEKGIEVFLQKLDRLTIDSLINNAGAYVAGKHYSEFKYQDLLPTFTLNAFAPILISSALFDKMCDREFGRIVNISSIAAKYGGSAVSIHYGCSKRALEGLTKTLAREGAGHNVLVNTIRPGVIDTDFHKKYPKDMTARAAMIPLGRLGTPDEVAGMAFYLGSEKNTFITNETLAVSGGE